MINEKIKEIFTQSFIEALQECSAEKMYSLCANYEDALAMFGDDNFNLTKEQVETNTKTLIEHFFESFPDCSGGKLEDSYFYNIGEKTELPAGIDVAFIDSFNLRLACKQDEISVNIKHLVYINKTIKINNMHFVKYEVLENKPETKEKEEIEIPPFLAGGNVMTAAQLKERVPSLPDVFTNFFSKGVYFDGDLKIEKDLDLNLSNGLTIVVRGDLHVGGDIVNGCGSTGDLLFVLGDVYAKNLFAGGSLITFKKDVYIDYFVCPYYNDGSLEIQTLKRGILLDDGEHCTFVHKLENRAVYFTYHSLTDPRKYPYSDFLEILTAIEDDEYLALNEYLSEKENNKNLYLKIQNYLKNKLESQKTFTNGEVVFYKDMMKDMNQRMSVGLIWETGFTMQNLDIEKNDKVKYFTEDLIVDDDFILDLSQHDGIKMIYVDGNMKVKGSLYHSLHEEAIILIVRGDIECQNLINAKSLILAKGKLNINNVFYLYNAVGAEAVYALGNICTKLAILEDDIVFVGKFDKKCTKGNVYSELTETLFGSTKPAIEGSFNFRKLQEILASKYWDITANSCLNKERLQADILDEKLAIN
jgi:hypothetical protein